MRPPTPGEDGRRIVRHGMADVLAWLGEPVGPAPGSPVLGLRDYVDSFVEIFFLIHDGIARTLNPADLVCSGCGQLPHAAAPCRASTV